MKRFAILVILLCAFLFIDILGQDIELYDREQLRIHSIQKLIEAEKSFDATRAYYEELIRIAATTGDERMQSGCLFQLARIYYWQAQFSLSLTETKKGLEIARRLEDNELMIVGYDLLGRLHYLFSPEQAQYYYRKCWQYCEESDSVELAISNLNSYNLIRTDNEVPLNDLLSIDIQSLSPISQAWLGYNIARTMIVAGQLDEALQYLEYPRIFLEKHTVASPMDALYEHRLSQIYLLRGDTKMAWEHRNKSLQILKKNKILLGIVSNYKIASEIAQAEKHSELALIYYRKSTALRDSIFNSVPNKYFPDDLVYTMMEYLTVDEAQIRQRGNMVVYILFVLCFIFGISLLYFFRSTKYRKKTDIVISDIKDDTLKGSTARLKNHLMKMMYTYKAGIYDCFQHMPEVPVKNDNLHTINYFEILEKNMHKADEFMDMLFEWVKSGSGMQPRNVDFDAKEVMEQIVALYEIAFVSKHINYQMLIDDSLIVHGDKIMFAISIEYLFSKTVKASAQNVCITVSGRSENGGDAIFCVADLENKENTLEKTIFAQRIGRLETEENAMRTADWDFNIFAECAVRNHASVQVKISPEIGTAYCFSMPDKF